MSAWNVKIIIIIKQWCRDRLGTEYFLLHPCNNAIFPNCAQSHVNRRTCHLDVDG